MVGVKTVHLTKLGSQKSWKWVLWNLIAHTQINGGSQMLYIKDYKVEFVVVFGL